MPVDLVGIHVQDVAAGGPIEPRTTQRPPDAHDVGVQRGTRLSRRRVVPDPIDERLRAHRPVGVNQQRG